MTIWPFTKAEVRPPPQRPKDNPSNSHCSFCGRPRKQVGPMVEGPNEVYICVACVTLAHQIAEANGMSPPAADLNDATVRWTGHMHIRCYFHLRQGADGGWIATNDHPQLLAGAGKTAKDAVRDLQAKVLVAASESFGRES